MRTGTLQGSWRYRQFWQWSTPVCFAGIIIVLFTLAQGLLSQPRFTCAIFFTVYLSLFICPRSTRTARSLIMTGIGIPGVIWLSLNGYAWPLVAVFYLWGVVMVIVKEFSVLGAWAKQ